MATKSPRNDNAGRNRKVTKFALAGVAVLGVGAALTSAAWTDNVFFAANAESGTIDLVGRVAAVELDPDYQVGGFQQATGDGILLTQIPVEAFGFLTPLDSPSVTLELMNDGDGDITLSDPATLGLGLLFTTPDTDGAVASATDDLVPGTVLSPGESVSFDVTVTTPDWDELTGTSLDGTVTVSVEGTT